ncbi:MAG: type II secretion system protein GspN [Desulfohalobiaceae bacterium]|nr:type II secretion system protein GspN [Desulfohalobiaceae bacterium]
MRGRKFALGLVYAAAALIVALLTAIVFFPYKALEARLEDSLQERTEASLRLAETGYSPPFGLSADRAIVSHDSRKISLQLTGIDLQWRPWALLGGEQRFVGQASACGGRIVAAVRFSSLFLRDSGAGSLEVRDLSLKECATALQLDRISDVYGRLQGEVRARNLRGGVEKMSGNASVKIDEAGLEFVRGLLKGLAIKDANLHCRLHKEGETLQVTETKLDSPGIEASLSGEMRIEGQLEKSALDLRTELEFHPGRLAGKPENSMVRQTLTRNKLELALQGTVASPRVRME